MRIYQFSDSRHTVTNFICAGARKTMLKSLFGDLYPLRDAASRRESAPVVEFAATAILETITGEVSDTGHLIDRHTRDLFVTGSPAQAMRAHFASQREENLEGQRFITLYDPAQMWAASVIKALSDASGQPIERLHLRDQTTLGTLAMIERTLLPRRTEDTLKIYHADVRAQGRDAQLIPLALMERSDLTVVIIGPMHSTAVESMIETLRRAAGSEAWRCQEMLFLLPVGAHWIVEKIQGTVWPAGVHVQVQTEPLTSASTVWNLLLTHWNRVRPVDPHETADVLPLPTPWPEAGPKAQALSEPLPSARALEPVWRPEPHAELSPVSDPTTVESHRPPPHPARAAAVLQELMLLDGLIFVALVDTNTGQVIASEGRGPDVDRAAAAAAEVLNVHRRTLRQMGHWRPNDPVDEILVTAGSRYHILRTLQAHPELFILAVLDKLRSNLAMTRFRIMEAQQVLV
jgi:predicted regulator of Ras-like GTPase activity (Roadblock/LC7/MglB family)